MAWMLRRGEIKLCWFSYATGAMGIDCFSTWEVVQSALTWEPLEAVVEIPDAYRVIIILPLAG